MDEGQLMDTTERDIRSFIYLVRGQQVMLDSDLAMLYQVETRVLNQAVKRNIKRFPERYCFQLTKEEVANLTSQLVILLSKCYWREIILLVKVRCCRRFSVARWRFKPVSVSWTHL